MIASRDHLRMGVLLALGTATLACASAASPPASPAHPTSTPKTATAKSTVPPAETKAGDLYPSTYKRIPAPPTLIRNATVLTAAGERIEAGSVLFKDGRIVAVGKTIEAPAGAVVVDATGKWVTPGIIDVHSHLGVYASPSVEGLEDGNEATDPVTADVWAEHSVWPQDPQFPLALAGGVTTMQILPGSANLVGGRSVTIKNVPARTIQGMKFPGAPYGLKMACGENPKRVYGEKGREPSTRMGNIAVDRQSWAKAVDYKHQWDTYREKVKKGEKVDPPGRDIKMETLVGVLNGEILIHNHCYRADEMAVMIDMAKEFGYKISAFHHAVESYKIADLLAKEGICSAMWADWWGFKMEALDGIRENIALVDKAGACAMLHSDSAEGIQRLNQEAAKAMAAGNRAGIPVTREQAIRWLTINPAKAIGVDKQTGSLETGKMADVVVWSGDPFSVYSRAEKVFVDGALLYDRDDPTRQPEMDFSLGTPTGGDR
jgi:imidazolonepropionase-like amidohydrolase